MVLAPAVIVHGLAMARLVVNRATALGQPATLLSAQGAAGFAGVGWWRALMAAGGAEDLPGVQHVLDCGDAGGRVLEALRAGQKLLVLRAGPLVWADLAGRAAVCGGMLLAVAPPALDLGVPGAEPHLDGWLAGDRRGEFG